MTGISKLEGKEVVGALFGATNINNNFDIVDAVSKEDPQGMTATFFVKIGDE